MKIGIQELLVVFIVALVVVGPDKLPVYAKKLGMALAQFRKFSEDATKDIRESIVEPLEEAQRPLREAMEPITELEKSVKSNVKDIQKSLSDIGKPEKAAGPPDHAEGVLEKSGEKTDAPQETAKAGGDQQEDFLEKPEASEADGTLAVAQEEQTASPGISGETPDGDESLQEENAREIVLT